jgi:hypothetical protein
MGEGSDEGKKQGKRKKEKGKVPGFQSFRVSEFKEHWVRENELRSRGRGGHGTYCLRFSGFQGSMGEMLDVHAKTQRTLREESNVWADRCIWNFGLKKLYIKFRPYRIYTFNHLSDATWTDKI